MRSIKLPSWIERLLGTDPQPVPPHVFALSEDALYYGRFVKAESGYEVEDFATVELPEEFFAPGPLGGAVHDPGLFKPLLAELVESVPGGVTEASLVLPDAWLRLAFAELGDLPGKGAKRDEALRWKLKRQVPFPVEDLRLRGVEVAPLPNQDEARRVMLGFGIDKLFGQIENTFEACGVRVGQILNSSLSTVSSVRSVVDELELAALVLVSAEGYSLTFTQRGEPLLYRFRALDTDLEGEAAAQLVLRDLKLTQTFIEEQLPDRRLGRVLLASPQRQQSFWLESLERGLGSSPVALGREQLPLRGQLPDVAPALLAPMVGAACRRVG